MLKRIRSWRQWRAERRQRLERARNNALLIVLGGTVTPPDRR